MKTLSAGFNLRIEVFVITGIINSMNTDILIPDDLFSEAERLAEHSNISYNQLFCTALKEYVERHSPEEFTNAMDKTCDEIGDTHDPFLHAAAHHILEPNEW